MVTSPFLSFLKAISRCQEKELEFQLSASAVPKLVPRRAGLGYVVVDSWRPVLLLTKLMWTRIKSYDVDIAFH